MGLANIAAAASEEILGRLLRQLAMLALVALFALIALYHFTAAGMVVLENEFGALYARLMLAGIFTVLALLSFGAWWVMRRKATASTAEGEPKPPHVQLAMLIEAAILGFETGNKRPKASR